MSTPIPVCPDCGRPQPDGHAGGPCLACLLNLGIVAGPSDETAILTPPAPPTQVITDSQAATLLAAEHPSHRIGRYKLLEVIGEGGFGTVWMAEQEAPVRRRVALKIIKLGMDTREVVARFEAERQALALMDHPNIARVFDGGATETGRPYFVMELVRGVRLTDYCDAGRLNSEERLNLFIQVCQAVQHAHQKGIIHRDLKPSNVLVTEHDGRAVPKVIDFGIAKAVEQKLTDKTFFTHFNQLIGTPAYMSPEQAGLGGLDIDTRSDVYALGVLLYELLTGRPPFSQEELIQSGVEEMLRLVREQEPPRPSTRVSALAREELAAVALHRGAAPEQLCRRLRGELDWVVMKALEKDRSRRYESAAALAQDLAHYLDDEPVSAAAPGVGYQMATFARRHRVALATAGAFALVLLIGTAVSAWQAVRATGHARAERREATNAVAARLESEGHRRNAEENFAVTRENLYAADVLLAQRALESGHLGTARAALATHRPRAATQALPDLRGFEWRYLWSQCQGDQLAILRGHSNAVLSLAFSSDGQTLLSAGADRTLRFWDVPARRLQDTVATFTNDVTTVAFLENGPRVLGAGAQGWVKLWTRSQAPPVSLLNAAPGDLALAPVQRRAAISTYQEGSERIRIYGLTNSGQPERSFTNVQGRAAFAHDGRRIAVAGAATVQIWEITDKRLVGSISLTSRVDTLLFSPDDRRLAGYARDGRELLLWDVDSGACVGQLSGQAGRFLDAAFSPNGQRLATANADSSVRVWDMRTLRELVCWRGHESEVRTIAFSPDGQLLASGGKDHTIRLWPAEPRPPDLAITNAFPPFLMSSDGRRLAAQTADTPRHDPGTRTWERPFEVFPDGGWRANPLDGTRRSPVTTAIWDAVTGEALEDIDLPSGSALLFASGGGWITIRRHWPQGVLCLHPTPTNGACVDLAGSQSTHLYSTLSADGRTAAVVTTAGSVRLYDARSGALLGELGETDRRQPVLKFSSDGTRLALYHSTLGATIWDVAARSRLSSLAGLDRPVNDFAFHPDGRIVATAGADNEIHLWDLRTGAMRARLSGHSGAVLRLAFSPDGKTLASADTDGIVQLWSMPSRREVATLTAGAGLTFLAFAAEGRALLGGNRLGRLYLWRAPALSQTDVETNSTAAETNARPTQASAQKNSRPTNL